MMENNTNRTDLTDTEVLYVTSKLLISVAIIALNGTVICVYCWKKRHFRYLPFNRFLLSLVICDFQTGIAAILTVIGSTVPMYMYPSTPGTYLFRILVDIYRAFLAKTVIFHLCGITLDRYLSLFYAYNYSTIVTSKSIKQYLCFSWVVPFIVSSIQLVWLYRVIANARDSKADANADTFYSIASIIIFTIIPLILLAFAFHSMFREIRRLERCVPTHHLNLRESKSRSKAVYVFGFMYLTFFLLATPYFSMRLWIDFNMMSGSGRDPSVVMVHLTMTMKDLSAIINPILYTTLFPQCRVLIRELRRKIYDNVSRCQLNEFFLERRRDKSSATEEILLHRVSTV